MRQGARTDLLHACRKSNGEPAEVSVANAAKRFGVSPRSVQSAPVRAARSLRRPARLCFHLHGQQRSLAPYARLYIGPHVRAVDTKNKAPTARVDFA
jgi:hypothetical protein